MVSNATILVVLVVLFLVGIKWTIDVIRGWPHRIPISRYLEQQRSHPITVNRQPGGDSFLASVLARWPTLRFLQRDVLPRLLSFHQREHPKPAHADRHPERTKKSA
jgi:hypothetical protein